MFMKIQQKLTALVLALMLLLTMVPMGAAAADVKEPDDSQQLTQEQMEILKKNLNSGAATLDAGTVTATAVPVIATKAPTYNQIFPSRVMEGMSTVVGEKMAQQYVLAVYGNKNQTIIVEIYKGEITNDTYVGGVQNAYPTSAGLYDYTVDWDTKGNKPGTYIVAMGTAYQSGGQLYLADDTIYTTEVYLTNTAAPLKTLYLKDANTDAKVTAKTINMGSDDYCCYVAFDPVRTTSSRKVSASSSNVKVATVEQIGGELYISPVGPGTCKIVAYAAGKQATINITVLSPATSVSLDKTSVSMHAGETVTLKAAVTPSNSTDKVTWTSSNPTVASVSNGVVTARYGGTVTITAKAGNYTATCQVKISQHEFTSTESELSCTTPDATIRTCSICGTVETEVRTPALGHDWDEGTVITEVTEEENGLVKFTCQRCGETKQKVVPATSACDGEDGCSSSAFTDAPAPDNWAHAGIDFAVSRKLFAGMTDTTFGPANSMQRAMLVAVLWRLEGRPEPKGTNTFADVPAGAYYEKAVAWASENNVVAGVGNNKFNPTGNVTREQIAAFLYRYARLKEYDIYSRKDLTTFPDVASVSSYAVDSLSWAVSENLVSGMTTGTSTTVILNPKGNATRAQVAAILMRFAYNVMGDDLADRVG